MQALLAPLALLIERFAGYPDSIVKRIGHPVFWIGALISLLDTRLNGGTNRRGKDWQFDFADSNTMARPAEPGGRLQPTSSCHQLQLVDRCPSPHFS